MPWYQIVKGKSGFRPVRTYEQDDEPKMKAREEHVATVTAGDRNHALEIFFRDQQLRARR